MFKKLFSKKQIEPVETPWIDDSDIKRLGQSFDLLRTTTSAVTEAAAETARVLEERLKDTEYRFFNTIDSIEDFVIIKDGIGRWKTLNRSGQDLFKWVHVEYHDKTDIELAELYPIFTECLNMCNDTDERAWLSGKSYRSQENIPYGVENYRCFDIVKTPVFYENGMRKELIVVGRDITEQKEKQRRINAAFIALNSISDIIVILDYRGNIYFCNDKFLDTFNIDVYEEVIGKHICEFIDKEGFDAMWEVISHNKEWDGTCTTDLDMHVAPMMNGMPYPIYYICTFKLKK